MIAFREIKDSNKIELMDSIVEMRIAINYLLTCDLALFSLLRNSEEYFFRSYDQIMLIQKQNR